MHQRTPLAVSIVALVVAIFGATPLGHAAGRLVAAVPPFAKTASYAKFAGNASKLNGRKSTLKGAPGTIPVVGRDGKLPASIGTVGSQGPKGDIGAKGDKGLKGDKGDTGDKGANGATKLVMRTTSTTSTGAFTYASAPCLPGEFATGGGVYMSNQSSILRFSRPVLTGETLTGWEGELTYQPTTQSIQVYAVCASP